jgi:thiamine biosynthesis lipoprotein
MRRVAELRFAAMGSTAHVVVVDGDPGAPAAARRLLADLERRWSRFLPGSEISRCNRARGRAVRVSAETRQLVLAATTGWQVTGGAFDPTVAHAMDANGYGGRNGDGCRAGAAPGLAGVEVDDRVGTVRLPDGVAFDPGGIGKGLAADLAVAEVTERGAAGALISVGGDVRVWGAPPRGGAWSIAVEDPLVPQRDAGVLALRAGAAATSSSLGRRWTLDGRDMHHIVDPRTGLPAVGDVVAVTAIAGAAWWAEVATKSLFLVGADNGGLLGDGGAIVWLRDGTQRLVGAAGSFFTPCTEEGIVA